MLQKTLLTHFLYAEKADDAIILSPMISFAATSHPGIFKLYVGNLPRNARSERLLVALRSAAAEEGFDAEDVLFVGVHRFENGGITARFAFAHVRDAVLDFLLQADIRAHHAILEISLAVENKKQKHE